MKTSMVIYYTDENPEFLNHYECFNREIKGLFIALISRSYMVKIK